jgi:hypothetical protein
MSADESIRQGLAELLQLLARHMSQVPLERLATHDSEFSARCELLRTIAALTQALEAKRQTQLLETLVETEH